MGGRFPNVIGAVAFHAAIDVLGEIGWDAIADHDDQLARRLHGGLAAIAGVRLLGPDRSIGTVPIGTFTVEGIPHARRGEAQRRVRHRCPPRLLRAHPHLIRLLHLSNDEIAAYRQAVQRGDRTAIPGAVRASAGLSTTLDDIDRLLAAVADIAGGRPAPVDYLRTPAPAIINLPATSPAGPPATGSSALPAPEVDRPAPSTSRCNAE